MSLYIFTQILVFLFVHDLSNEYDLKKEEQKANRISLKEERKQRNDVNWKRSLLNSDILLILFSTFVSSLLITVLVLLQPVIVLQNLKYSPSILNTGLVCQTAFCSLSLIILLKAKISSHSAYFIGIISVLSI